MTELHTDAWELFISPQANGDGNGSSFAPYGSFDEAMAELTRRLGKSTSKHTGFSPKRPLEIVCIERPGASFPPQQTPRHQYYVDPYATPLVADGSELAPWPSLTSAVDRMLELRGKGQLDLAPGERIRVSLHDVFTPTDVEKAKNRSEAIAKSIFLLMTAAAVIPVILILGVLVVKAWPALSLSLLFENPIDGMTAGGIWAPMIGTFFLVLLSLAITAPVGVLAGVYLNEYAPDNWINRAIQLAVVNLAGVPSIVHALFGVGAFVLTMNMGASLLAAACTIGVMTLPVIIASTREALAAVPMSFREACWNMGASRWQTIRTIVLPNSISGILTGVILQVSRTAGETAPILFTGAVYFVSVPDHGVESFFPYGLHDQFMALSYHLFALSTQVPNVPEGLQYGTAVVLIGLVLLVNSFSIALRVYLRSRKKW